MVHHWVAERRDHISFGVQVFALPEDPSPTRRVLDAGQLAESLGIDAFFIGDHPGYQTDAWLHLAALAATTSRIGLGSVVNCVFHRHPAILARHAADLDRISDGRCILGLGIGWNDAEFGQLGLRFPPVPERQDALEEAVEIVRALFGPTPATFDGRFWSTRGGHVSPGPVQQPGPPILIAGSGNRTLRQVARLADIANFGAGRNVGRVRDVDDIHERFAYLKSACDAIGRPFEEILRSHFTTWMMLAETEQAAKAKVNRYYPDGMNEDQQRTRIWGTPAAATEYFQTLVEAGVQYFVVQILDAADTQTMELLATEVIPQVTSG